MGDSVRKYLRTASDMFADKLFKQYLASTKLVAIGRLEQVYADSSKGLVSLFNDAHTQVSVEICLAGGLGIAQAGQCGLVIIAQNNVDIANATIDISEPDYSGNYAKFIPLSLAGRSMVSLESSGKGIAVGSKNYSLEYGDKNVTLISDKLTLNADISAGTVNLYTQEGTINISLTQTSLKAQFGAVSSEEADITELVAQQDSISAHIGKAVAITANKDDGLSANIGTDVTITANKDDGISLKSAKLKLDGDVTITGALNVANGNFTVDK